jgi:hypothetical protein
LVEAANRRPMHEVQVAGATTAEAPSGPNIGTLLGLARRHAPWRRSTGFRSSVERSPRPGLIEIRCSQTVASRMNIRLTTNQLVRGLFKAHYARPVSRATNVAGMGDRR